MVRNGHIEEERVFSEPIETGWLRKQILGGGGEKTKIRFVVCHKEKQMLIYAIRGPVCAGSLRQRNEGDDRRKQMQC